VRRQKESGILPESLSGLIERVTFANEDSGFSVLNVKVKGHRDLVTVVGSLPSVSAGEWLTAQGRWVQDREFGLQFRGGNACQQRADDQGRHRKILEQWDGQGHRADLRQEVGG